MKKEESKTTDRKPDTSMVSEMLTPSEIEQLRQNKKELSAYAAKAFARLKKNQ